MSTTTEILEKEPQSVPAEIQQKLDEVAKAKGTYVEPDKKPEPEAEVKKEKVVEKKEIKSNEEVNAEDILSSLKKIKGFENITSLDDLKKAQKEEAKEEETLDKKDQIKKWAIENKKVKKELLEEFEKDSQLSNVEKAFKAYQAERANETNELTDELYTEEELRAEFEDENYLYLEDTDPKYKRAMSRIELLAKTYDYDKYKELNSIESEFENHIETLKTQNTLSENVSKSIPDILKDGLSYSIKDDSGNALDIKVPVTKKALEEISLASNELQDVNDLSQIKAVLATKYVLKNLDKVIHEVATAYHSQKLLDKIAASKGIDTRKSEFESKTGDIPPEIQAALEKAEQRRKTNY